MSENTEYSFESDFENRLSSISKQSGIVYIGQVFLQITGFISGVIIARFLGAFLFGQYNLGMVVVRFLSNFCVLGSDRGLVKFIPVYNLEDKGKTKQIIITSTLLCFLTSTIIAVLLYIFSDTIAIMFFDSENMSGVLRIFSLYLPVFSLFRIFLAVLRGFKRADLQAFVWYFISPLLFLLMVIPIYFFGFKLGGVIAARIISHLCGLICLAFFVLKVFPEITTVIRSRVNIKEYFSFSFPLLFIGLLHFLIGNIGILMIGYFREEDAAGIYSVAVRISLLSLFFLTAVNSIFGPNMSELTKLNDFENIKKLMNVLTKWITYGAGTLLAIVIVLHDDILHVFGREYISGTVPLLILMTGQFCNALAGPTGVVLVMSGKQKYEVFNSIAIVIANILLCYILIPRFGVTGAAVSMAVSIIGVNILKVSEVYYEFRFHPYSLNYLKGCGSILLGAGLVYSVKCFLDFHYIVNILMYVPGMLIFSAVCYYVLKPDPEDIFIFNKIKANLGVSERKR